MALTRPKIWDLDTNIAYFMDPITVLHQGATSNNVDVGFLFNRANGLVANVAMYWSESGQAITYAMTANTGVTDSNITPSSYANVSIGNLLMVNGSGIYVGGNIGFPGSVLASDGTKSFWTASGGFTGGSVPNQLIVANSIQSTSTTSGAFTVTGGVGIGANLYVGGNLVVSGNTYQLNTEIITQSVVDAGSLTVSGVTSLNGATTNVGGKLAVSGNTTVTIATASTSSTTGALIVTGGVGIGGAVYTGSTITASGVIAAQSGTASTSTTTGALVVTGGLGVSGAAYAGSVYDNSNRVLTSLSSSGTGNLTVSVSAPASTTISLPATGPGALTTGSATAIPVITTDAYGRISAITTASVSSTLNLAGTSGTGSVALTNQSLTFAGSNGVTASASGQTITISTPQNLQTSASPTFVGLTLNPTSLVTVNKPSTTGYQSVAQFGSSSGGLFLTSDSPIISTGTYYNSGWITTATSGSYLNFAGGALDFQNFSGATVPAAPTLASKFNVSSAGVVTAYNNILPSASASYNLGSATATWSTVYAKATSALYADLAENYTADQPYKPGTVVVFGGEAEITISTVDHDSAVAGVISTDPAYLMNSECKGLPVALQGRVPCRVQGPVKKGQVLVTSNTPGVAQAIDNAKFVPGCVIGKALNAINTNNIETIEVVVGKH